MINEKTFTDCRAKVLLEPYRYAAHCIAFSKTYSGTKSWVLKPLRQKAEGPIEMQHLLKALNIIFEWTSVTILYGMDYGKYGKV